MSSLFDDDKKELIRQGELDSGDEGGCFANLLIAVICILIVFAILYFGR